MTNGVCTVTVGYLTQTMCAAFGLLEALPPPHYMWIRCASCCQCRRFHAIDLLVHQPLGTVSHSKDKIVPCTSTRLSALLSGRWHLVKRASLYWLTLRLGLQYRVHHHKVPILHHVEVQLEISLLRGMRPKGLITSFPVLWGRCIVFTITKNSV